MRNKKKGHLQFFIAVQFIEIVVFGIMAAHINNVFSICSIKKIRRADISRFIVVEKELYFFVLGIVQIGQGANFKDSGVETQYIIIQVV